jgi:DNA-binding NarL/FixJ family response regulator
MGSPYRASHAGSAARLESIGSNGLVLRLRPYAGRYGRWVVSEDMSIRVVIADDHPLARQGLREYLERERDIEVVAEVDSGFALLDLLGDIEVQPDVALVDARMPSMDGIEATRRMRKRFPGVNVIILSAFDDPNLVSSAIAAGARAYLLKSKEATHITRAVHLVADGDLVIDPEAALPFIGRLSIDGAARSDTLSEPEIEVLRLLSRGSTNKEIARTLKLSPETVKGRLARVFRKLGAPDRAAAVAEALRRHAIE